MSTLELDVHKYCRTCAEFFEDSILIPAFEEIEITTKTNDEFQLAEEIKLLSIQIEKDDGLPQGVCIDCVKHLTRIYEFRQICFKSQKTLEEYFKNIKEPVISNEQLDDVKEDIKFQLLAEEIEYLESDVEMNDREENLDSSDDVERGFAELFDALDGTMEFDDDDVLKNNNGNNGDPIVTDSAYASNTNSSNVKSVESENKVQCNETKLATEDDNNKQDDSRANESLLDSEINKSKKTVDENETEKRWFQTKKKRRYKTKIGEPTDSESKLTLRKCLHCNYYKFSSRFKSDILSCRNRKIKAPSDTEFYCFYCYEKFDMEKVFEDHMTSTHTIEEPYNCKMCEKKFKNYNLLRKHIESLHDGDVSKKCRFCEKIFPSSYHLRRHKEVIHCKKSYECKVCLKKFQINSHFRHHIKTHDEKRQYKCRYCDRRFNQRPHRTLHEEIHTNTDNPYKCEKCGKTFVHSYYYRTHLKTHDGSTLNICEVCGKGFPLQYLLNGHIKGVHAQYQCEICGKKLTSLQYLRKHRLTHFQNEKPNIDEVQPQTAEYCKKYRKKTQEVKVRLYKCLLCNRGFDIPSALEKHMNLHDKNRQFPCELCKTSYLKLSHLKTHINRVHSKTEKFSCSYCDKIFYDSSERNSHILCSHIEKKAKCVHCNKMISKKNLKAHENTHVRPEKYVCLVCGKRFTTYIPLKNHCKKHSPEEIKYIEEKIMIQASVQTQANQDNKDSN